MPIEQKLGEFPVDVGLDERVLLEFRYKQFRPDPKQVDLGVKDREELEFRFFANGELPIGFVEYLNGIPYLVNTGYFKSTVEDVRECRTGRGRRKDYPRNSTQRLYFSIKDLQERLVEDQDGKLVTSGKIPHLPYLPVGERFQRGEYEFLLKIDSQNFTVQQTNQAGQTKILKAGLLVDDPKGVVANLITYQRGLGIGTTPITLTYQNPK